MLKCFLFIFMISVFVPLAIAMRGMILGPGRWLVLNIIECENPDQYEIMYNINRKKINRTHDCFNMNMELDRVINTTYAIHIDVYQEFDGRFNFYKKITDDCACSFVMTHAGVSAKRALTMANIDPPDCPLQPGPITINNFVMDYRELSRHSVYGTFQADVYLLYNKVRLACTRVIANFEYVDDEADDFDFDDYGDF
nr:uncharacterized protein LOC110383489 [Helicoverpa armigera]